MGTLNWVSRAQYKKATFMLWKPGALPGTVVTTLDRCEPRHGNGVTRLGDKLAEKYSIERLLLRRSSPSFAHI